MAINRSRRRRMVAMLLGGRTYIQKVLSTAPLVYYPMSETSGTTLNDATGVYTKASAIGADVVLGAAGPAVVGHTAMTFDSANANSSINIYAAALATAFNYAAYTISMWYRPANWTSGTYLFRFLRDGNNQVYIQKENTNDRLVSVTLAGGTQEIINGTVSQTYTTWKHVAITFDRLAGVDGEFKLYIDGAQDGTTQTGLGTYAGAWAVNGMWVGAAEGAPLWIGGLSDFAIWTRALTLAEVRLLAGL